MYLWVGKETSPGVGLVFGLLFFDCLYSPSVAGFVGRNELAASAAVCDGKVGFGKLLVVC